MTNTPLKIPQPRFLLIDAARGLAALAVVFYHAMEGRHLTALEHAAHGPAAWLLTAIRHGNQGVPVFFVISGFVIAHSLAAVTVRPGSFGRFVLRRAARLDPPYWASLVLVIVTASLAHKAGPLTPGRLTAHLFYAQDLVGTKALSSVYWTLCLEVQFYLAFALLLGVCQWLQRGMMTTRPGLATAAVFGPAVAVSLLWPLGLAQGNVRGLFPPLWHGFLLGAVCYWALFRTVPRWAFYAFAGTVLVAGGLRQDAFSITCGLASVVFYAAGRTGVLGRRPTARPVLLLGTISYSLYLTHNAVSGAAFRVWVSRVGDSATKEAVGLGLIVGLCVGFAWLFYQAVERPSMLLAKRLGRRPTIAAVGEREQAPTRLSA